MSLWLPAYWLPDRINFVIHFTQYGVSFQDYFSSTVISILFSVIQTYLCGRILMTTLWHNSSLNDGPTANKRFARLSALSGFLACAFVTTTIVYCKKFMMAVGSLHYITEEERHQMDPSQICFSFRPNSPTMKCIPASFMESDRERLVNGAYASLVNIIIAVSNVYLLRRSSAYFKGDTGFNRIAKIAFRVYLASLLLGLAYSGITGLIPPFVCEGDPRAPLVALRTLVGNSRTITTLTSQPISIIASLLVNIVFTGAVASHILEHATEDTTWADLLTDASVAPLVFGTFAVIFSIPLEGVQSVKSLEFHLIPRVAWLAVTAVSPQLMILRSLEKRDWLSRESVLDGANEAGSVVLGDSGRKGEKC